MNNHNLESDISIRTVYTQQIMAQFHNFKPFQSQHNAIIGIKISDFALAWVVQFLAVIVLQPGSAQLKYSN